MVEHHPFLFSYSDDVTNTIWCAGHRALLAIRIINGFTGAWIFIHHLAECENLSYRDFALWQKANLERDDEMVKKIRFLQVDILYSYPYIPVSSFIIGAGNFY